MSGKKQDMAKKNAKTAFSLSVQYADTRLKERISRHKLRHWVAAALQQPARLVIRFVDAGEGQMLNKSYRQKNKATNVLAFVYEDLSPASSSSMPEADIILCTDVLEQEAEAQNKTLEAHVAHLVIHGVLHAQGYSHEKKSDAQRMEALETQIMQRLGFADPYQQ